MDKLEAYVSLGVALKTVWGKFVEGGTAASTISEEEVCRLHRLLDELLRSFFAAPSSSTQKIGSMASAQQFEAVVLSDQGAEVMPLIVAMSITSEIPSPKAQLAALSTLKTLTALCNRSSVTSAALFARMFRHHKAIEGLTLALRSAVPSSEIQLSVLEMFFAAIAGNENIAAHAACSPAVAVFVALLDSTAAPVQAQYLVCAIIQHLALCRPREHAAIVLVGQKCHAALLNLVQRQQTSTSAAVTGIALHVLAVLAKYCPSAFTSSMTIVLAPLCLALLRSRWSEILCGTCVWIRSLLSPATSRPQQAESLPELVGPEALDMEISAASNEASAAAAPQSLFRQKHYQQQIQFAEHLGMSDAASTLLLLSNSPHCRVAAAAASALRCIVMLCPRQSARLVLSNRFLYIVGTLLSERFPTRSVDEMKSAESAQDDTKPLLIVRCELASVLGLSLLFSPSTRRMFRSKVAKVLDPAAIEKIHGGALSALDGCHLSFFEDWCVTDSSGFSILRYFCSDASSSSITIDACVDALLAQTGPPMVNDVAGMASTAALCQSAASQSELAQQQPLQQRHDGEACLFILGALRGAIEDTFYRRDNHHSEPRQLQQLDHFDSYQNVTAVATAADSVANHPQQRQHGDGVVPPPPAFGALRDAAVTQDDCDKGLKLILCLSRHYGIHKSNAVRRTSSHVAPYGNAATVRRLPFGAPNFRVSYLGADSSLTGYGKEKNEYAAKQHTPSERHWSIRALHRDDLFLFRIPFDNSGGDIPAIDAAIEQAKSQTALLGTSLRTTPISATERRALLRDLHLNVLPRVVTALTAIRNAIERPEGASTCIEILRERKEQAIDSGNLLALYTALVGVAL